MWRFKCGGGGRDCNTTVGNYLFASVNKSKNNVMSGLNIFHMIYSAVTFAMLSHGTPPSLMSIVHV